MAVAVLFSTSLSVMVTTMSSVSVPQAGQPALIDTSPCARSSVPPDASSAAPRGIIEPSSTTTGHSIWS